MEKALTIGTFTLSLQEDKLILKEISFPFFRSLENQVEKPIKNLILNDSIERGEVEFDLFG